MSWEDDFCGCEEPGFDGFYDDLDALGAREAFEDQCAEREERLVDGEQDLPDGDYRLVDGCAWFTVGGFSVRISLAANGTLAVNAYRLGEEAEDAVAGFTAESASSAT